MNTVTYVLLGYKIEHQLSKCPQQNCSSIFLINYWCGRAQPILDDVTPGQVILDGIWKQAEQTVRDEPVSSVPQQVLLQFCL